MKIEDIIKKWCETNQLDLTDLSTLIVEYYQLYGQRNITSEQLTALLQVYQYIDIEYIISYICNKKNYYLVYLTGLPDQFGNRPLIKRYFYT